MHAIDLTRELVSFSTPSRDSNADISDFVERVLRSVEFETERIEYRDDNGVLKVNVVGRKGPAPTDPATDRGGLTFFGHTDTVPADHWTEGDPCRPFVREGKLYGRGTCDMKGPVACMIAAAARLNASQLRRPLFIVCTADEEIGYAGATNVVNRSQLFSAIRNGVGIIGEPTRLEVVYAHKGVIGFIATARGVAAHSSTGLGRNANLAMIPFLAEMKAIHDELQTDPKFRNEEFQPPTPGWNICMSDGNTPPNVTAPQCVATVYFRSMPGNDIEQLVGRVQRAAHQNGLELVIRGHGRPVYTDPKSEFCREVLDVSGRSVAGTVPYGTDGLCFGQYLPLVVFGPGDIAQAHTSNEWIEIDQLTRGTDLYCRLIERFCS